MMGCIGTFMIAFGTFVVVFGIGVIIKLNKPT
jgi:hypothetical protein